MTKRRNPEAEQSAEAMASATVEKVDNPIPDDRAAERFRQIAHYERDLAKIRRRIVDKKTELKTLNEQENSVLEQILEAARDEGEMSLPLEDE